MSDSKEYNIPKEAIKLYPDLIKLIKDSDEIDNEEKEYWFSTLLAMSSDQVNNLKMILKNDSSSDESIKKKENERVARMDKIKSEEEMSEEKEKSLEYDLLSKL